MKEIEQDEFSRDLARRSGHWFVVLMLGLLVFGLTPILRFVIPGGVPTSWLMIMTFSLLVVSPLLIRHLFKIRNQLRNEFWNRLAKERGWIHENGGDVSSEDGLMFKEGNNRKVNHIIKGSVNSLPLKIIDYQFTVPSGDAQQSLFFTAFIFEIGGNFPHCYLDKKENWYKIKGLSNKLSLPREFEKQFQLWVPSGYEMEALQIFTPDLMSKILDFKFSYDIELVNRKLIIYVEGIVYGNQNLEKELSTVFGIKDIFAPKLEHFKFTPIGDHPSFLAKL